MVEAVMAEVSSGGLHLDRAFQELHTVALHSWLWRVVGL